MGLPTEILNLLFNDLRHFQKPGKSYRARYHHKSSAVENLPLLVQERQSTQVMYATFCELVSTVSN